MFVPWLVSVTVAPGTTAPEESVTVPLASPPRVCANAGSETARDKMIDVRVDFFVSSIDASTVCEQAGVSSDRRMAWNLALLGPERIARIYLLIQDKKSMFQDLKSVASLSRKQI